MPNCVEKPFCFVILAEHSISILSTISLVVFLSGGNNYEFCFWDSYPPSAKQNLEKTRLRAESCISKRVVMRDSKGSGNVVLEVVKCNDERNSSRF